jgi:putative intracellular protease/amidase
MALPQVLIVMADYGHDPTETVIPYKALSEAGFPVHFCTETGKVPACDRLMLEGLTQKLLGATAATVREYHSMVASKAFQNPLAWTAPGFSFDSYAMVHFPGGHDKDIRQMIDSPVVHRLIVDYFPQTKKPAKKSVAAICHGVMALSNARGPGGESPIARCDTTALPGSLETGVYWATWPILGAYYKTYGKGSENVEDSVRKVLVDPDTQWKSAGSLSQPFVVEDKNHHYITARYPVDAQLFAETLVQTLESFRQ